MINNNNDNKDNNMARNPVSCVEDHSKIDAIATDNHVIGFREIKNVKQRSTEFFKHVVSGALYVLWERL